MDTCRKKMRGVIASLGLGVASFGIPDRALMTAEPGGPRGEGAAVSGSGDVNGDREIDISDAIYILNWLFLGGPEPRGCENGAVEPRALPDTGQVTCYNSQGDPIDCADSNCPGQDGYYHTGCPSEGRYVDNGDGTVTDNCTDLQWLKETADVNGDGQINDDGDVLDWCSSLQFCESLDFAGHDDWRLPNVREFQSIIDYGEGFMHPVLTARTYLYWSSTNVTLRSPDWAWYVHLGSGCILGYPKDSVYFVLAVRSVSRGAKVDGGQGRGAAASQSADVNGDGYSDVSDASYLLGWLFFGGGDLEPCEDAGRDLLGLPDSGQTFCIAGGSTDCVGVRCPGQDGFYEAGCPIRGRFVDNRDGTITDSCTGLQWLKETADVNGDGQISDDGDLLNWCSSLQFCERLIFAGHEDWRLPNVRELQSIVDYGQGSSLSACFCHWSSTTVSPSTGRAWIVDLHNGFVVEEETGEGHLVRAVRGDL
jgi:hypothetical protein